MGPAVHFYLIFKNKSTKSMKQFSILCKCSIRNRLLTSNYLTINKTYLDNLYNVSNHIRTEC